MVIFSFRWYAHWDDVRDTFSPYAIQTLIDAIASIDVIQQLFSLSVGMLLSRLLRMISNTKYDTAIPRNRKKELHFSITAKNHVRQQ
jgi:hypothetical protein